MKRLVIAITLLFVASLGSAQESNTTGTTPSFSDLTRSTTEMSETSSSSGRIKFHSSTGLKPLPSWLTA